MGCLNLKEVLIVQANLAFIVRIRMLIGTTNTDLQQCVWWLMWCAILLWWTVLLNLIDLHYRHLLDDVMSLESTFIASDLCMTRIGQSGCWTHKNHIGWLCILVCAPYNLPYNSEKNDSVWMWPGRGYRLAYVLYSDGSVVKPYSYLIQNFANFLFGSLSINSSTLIKRLEQVNVVKLHRAIVFYLFIYWHHGARLLVGKLYI